VQALAEWHTWATQQVQAFQRASSAVEGRTGYGRNGILISEAYQHGGTRCGRSCLTALAVLQMGRRLRRGLRTVRE
jgi:hypothetical protein